MQITRPDVRRRLPGALALLALLLAGCAGTPPKSLVTPPAPLAPPPAEHTLPAQPGGPVRGVWLTTVSHLDWPPVASLQARDPQTRIRQQQQALRQKLDRLAALGINTVFFQVKPDGSALWRSEILPWSDLLTGRLGDDPGYDPLRFLLDEAHQRGMRLHAWFNPYRITVNTRPATVAALQRTLSQQPASVFVLHPEWVRKAGDRYVLDPGIPAVRDWITSIVMEVVSHYNIDGVQFDDYFYSETRRSPLDDSASWHQYGSGFASKADWRRDNTLRLIEQVSRAIKQVKPAVAFGVSPAGVWRNRDHDAQGSDTRGAAAYDESYADTRQWVQKGLLDYIAPQLYWPFSRKAARYDVLAKWWAQVVNAQPASHPVKLYIGIALYKVGEPSRSEPEWTEQNGVPELKRQLDLNESLPGISGTLLFREGYLDQPQTRQAVEYLQTRWGKAPQGNGP